MAINSSKTSFKTTKMTQYTTDKQPKQEGYFFIQIIMLKHFGHLIYTRQKTLFS